MHAASEDLSSALRQRAARRSTWVSVGVNTVLSALQLVVGLAAHSQALVADAVHSLSDLVSDFVVLLANRHSHQAADDGHPYGHQRFETGANLVLGLLLLGVGLGMEWAALDKLQSPQAPSALGGAALWVAFGALVCKEALFHYLLRVAKEVKSSMLVANAWHARSDAASSLVVLAGLVGSLAGYPLLDPIAAMVVGLLIVKMGWHFAWNALGDLMDRGADRLEVQAIDATLHPEAQHVVHRAFDVGVAPVDVRLLDEERVQVVLLRRLVPLPRGAAERRDPVVRRAAIGLGVAPDVPVALRVVR